MIDSKIPDTSPPVNRPPEQTERKLTFYNDIQMRAYPILGGYSFDSLDGMVYARLTNIANNHHGKIAELYLEHPTGTPIIQGVQLHLQDYQAREKISRQLATTYLEYCINWPQIFDQICTITLKNERELSPIQDISLPPEKLHFETEIQGLCLPRKMHSTIFSPGGKGKSILAQFFAVIKTYGIVPEKLPFAPFQGNVLYCDWESSSDVMQIYINAIKNGLGISEHLPIFYQDFNGRSIFDVADAIRELIISLKIELAIMDSQMAATAGGPQFQSEADKASAYYNLLSSFECTTLTIDHSTKAEMSTNNTSGAAYGPVVKFNRARSQYELRSQQDTDSDHMEFALIHTKYNLGRKQKPIGIAIDFENVGEELRSLKVYQCDIANNPELEKSLPQYTRIKNAILDNGGKATPATISTVTGISGDSVSMTLSHYKKMFIQVDKNQHLWGVIENVDDK